MNHSLVGDHGSAQVQTGGTTIVTMAPSTLPPSPTLTNPDMILPYDDGEYDTAPSLQHNTYSPQWRDPTDMQFSLDPSQMSSVSPTTPIIYGNGTMLSDIGEVTEAESAVGARKLPGPAERRMLKQAQANNLPLRSSPTVGYESVMKRAKGGNHQRNVSTSSSSTITSGGHSTEMFKDFDDGVSVDDSNFQGDDEESVADSYSDPYREELVGQETKRLANRVSTIGEEEDGDSNSSAALSRRAEQILLNAKKRLNNMEGNLTRARSSFVIPPSRSMPSIHSSSPLSRSTPSPPGPGFTQLGNGPSTHRQLHTKVDSPMGTPGHSRVYSENSIPSPLGKGRFPVRSASAAARYIPNNTMDNQRRLGYAYSSDSLLEDSKAASRPAFPSPLSRTSPPRASSLAPLAEHSIPEFDRAVDRSSVASSMDGFTGVSGDHALTRSASTAQMRDLRDQMHDLKGRLSVLRDRTRDDTMKRKSMQSLRTPSPFTAAEQWYLGDKGYKVDPLSADAGTSPTRKEDNDAVMGAVRSPNTASNSQEDLREEPGYESSNVTSVYEDMPNGHHFSEVPQRTYQPPAHDEVPALECPTAAENEADLEEDDYNDEIVSVSEADDYETDDSLYHDTYEAPISHEDREDAFDYEHFFLHSAMGTISREARNRSGSFSSEDSVETARGPIIQKAFDPRPSLGHIRNKSNTSISTINTFATAEEGQTSEDESDEENVIASTPRDQDEYAVQDIKSPGLRVPSPTAVKRSTFGGDPMNFRLPEEVHTPREEGLMEEDERPTTMIKDGDERTPTGAQRPSVSSLDSCSTGSTRSFPLVNKSKLHQQSAESDSAALNGSRGSGGSGGSATLVDPPSATDEDRLQTSPVHMLAKDDQILVERLVASLGKTVLGLQESPTGSYDSRVWRRRLDAARRVLEGQEGAV